MHKNLATLQEDICLNVLSLQRNKLHSFIGEQVIGELISLDLLATILLETSNASDSLFVSLNTYALVMGDSASMVVLSMCDPAGLQPYGSLIMPVLNVMTLFTTYVDRSTFTRLEPSWDQPVVQP